LGATLGYETVINQDGTNASPEVNTKIVFFREEFPKIIDSLELNYDYRRQEQTTDSFSYRASMRSQSIYANFDVNKAFAGIDNILPEFKIIGKYDDELTNGEINPTSIMAVTRHNTNATYGCKIGVVGGLSAYAQYLSERETDNTIAGNDITRNTPFYRLSYDLNFGGIHTLNIYYDYSAADQTGATAYNKTDNGYGLLWNFPVDNPVLYSAQIGMHYKKTDYKDINNASNDYSAGLTEFQMTMAF